VIRDAYLHVHGTRARLEELGAQLTHPFTIEDYPARSMLAVCVPKDSRDHLITRDYAERFSLDMACRVEVRASPEELQSAAFFSDAGGAWYENDDEVFDPPQCTEDGRCPSCGRGAMQLACPLTAAVKEIPGRHLMRLDPHLLVASAKLVNSLKTERWSGALPRPILDRTTGRESRRSSALEVTSILEPMLAEAPIERSCIADHCDACRRLGYQYAGDQLAYDERVLANAKDWNFSAEWTGPGYLSFPQLVCSRRVVQRLVELQPSHMWVPVDLREARQATDDE